MSYTFNPGDEVVLINGDEDDILIVIGSYNLNSFGHITPMYKVVDAYGNALRYKETELRLATDKTNDDAIAAYNRAMKIL